MPPSMALLLWLVLLLVLLGFDPAREPKVSIALWIPTIWLFITASRLPSQWLGLQMISSEASVLEEGNPLNRTIFFILILIAVAILVTRSFKWGEFVIRNPALIAFIAFALLSVFWSDFAYVSFKRWFRDLGNYLMILVVLSDPRPFEAVRTVLRRLSYFTIPLSIILVKYFVTLGRGYSPWTGETYFVGVTSSKNMLGVLCLVSGLYFFWDVLNRWPHRGESAGWKALLVDFIFIGMTLRLLLLSDSATSRVCLALGCMVILAAHSSFGRRHATFLKFAIPAVFFVYLILAFGFGINGQMASAVGRDSTLTDRTAIWQLLLSLKTNPVMGTGYESFWLGSRLQRIWHDFGPINESHNGYLEVYLNLGMIGLFLIAALLVSSYRNICSQLASAPEVSSLYLGLWTITLFYNMTEAAFKSHLMWLTFLLTAIVVPQRAEQEEQSTDLPPFPKLGGQPFLPPHLQPLNRPLQPAPSNPGADRVPFSLRSNPAAPMKFQKHEKGR